MKRKKILAAMLATVMLVMSPVSAALGAQMDTGLIINVADLAEAEEAEQNGDEEGGSIGSLWSTADEDTAAEAGINASEDIDAEMSVDPENPDDDMNLDSESLDDDMNLDSESLDDDMSIDSESLDDDMSVDSEGQDDDMNLDSEGLDDDMNVDLESSDEEMNSDGQTADEGEDTPETTASTVAYGYCGEDAKTVTWVLSDDGTLTISGTGAMATYAVNTTSVADTSSNPPWFGYNDTITSVVIESGVTSIGAYAFMHCVALTSITIPDTVTTIGARAFYECTAIETIVIPDSVTTIGSYAFLYCSSLKNLTISANLTSITSCMFGGCSSLTSITIPGKVTSIAVNAFSGCNSLESIVIPASVLTITDAAISDCPALSSITVAEDNPNYCSVDGVLFNKAKTELILYPAAKQGASYSIPSGVSTIVSGAFCNCVVTSVTIPDTVTTIEDFAFEACENLVSVEVPDSVTDLGTCVFYDCSGLTSAVIGDGVSEIPYGTFEYCLSLITVTVPDCTVIGERAFYKCTSLAKVYYGGSKTSWAALELESSNDSFAAAKIYYGIGGCTITLSTTSYTYNGKSKKPAVTVTDGETTLTKGTDYTSVTYSDNTEPGTASVTITGKGDYKGSTATVYFTINKKSQTVTASASASSVTAGQTVTITASGLGTITYSSSDTTIAKVSSKGVVTGKKPGTVKITVTASGNDYYAAASVTVKVKVKLAAGTISSLTNKTSGIVVKWAKITGADGYYVYRRTSSGSYSKIATITSGSTVRYVDTKVKNKNGTTYVYKVIAYSGTTTNSCTAKKTVRLTTPSLTGVTNSVAGSATLSWSKSSKATGYQIQYSTSSSFASGKTKTVWVKTPSQVSQTLTGLTGGETYYIRIRTYYKNSSGTKYYSAWSEAQAVILTA